MVNKPCKLKKLLFHTSVDTTLGPLVLPVKLVVCLFLQLHLSLFGGVFERETAHESGAGFFPGRQSWCGKYAVFR